MIIIQMTIISNNYRIGINYISKSKSSHLSVVQNQKNHSILKFSNNGKQINRFSHISRLVETKRGKNILFQVSISGEMLYGIF
jgi:hypothetical protein